MTKRTKPVLGAIWGLLLGIGLAGVAVTTKISSVSIVAVVIWVVLGIVLGVLWSTLGPAKRPSGTP